MLTPKTAREIFVRMTLVIRDLVIVFSVNMMRIKEAKFELVDVENFSDKVIDIQVLLRTSRLSFRCDILLKSFLSLETIVSFTSFRGNALSVLYVFQWNSGPS